MDAQIDGSGHFHADVMTLLQTGDFTSKSCGCKRALQAKYRHSAKILPSEVLESCEDCISIRYNIQRSVSNDPVVIKFGTSRTTIRVHDKERHQQRRPTSAD